LFQTCPPAFLDFKRSLVMTNDSDSSQEHSPARVFFSGILMGLANVVPGVSGGTMILAMGLYDAFIDKVARLSSFRWNLGLFIFFAIFGVGLVIALVGGSKVAVTLVAEQRWIMYSLFIGLTLGGVPELIAQCRPAKATVWIGGVIGFALMATLAFVLDSAPVPQNMMSFFLVGALAASSMILPGISGSTILLIFGFYEVVIGSLSSDALREDLMGSLMIVGPVGAGAAVGIALLSNVLKVCLAKYRLGSHGFLMGLLVGSLLVIIPFQEPVNAELAVKAQRKAVAMVLEGATAEQIEEQRGVQYDDVALARIRKEYDGKTATELKRMSDKLTYFSPSLLQALSSLGLIIAGYIITQLIGRLGAKPTD
jgi:putative membrane protein